MNTNVSKFLNKQNLKLLWDVLLDELRIEPTNKTVLTNIRTVFESNIQPFTKNTGVNSNVQLVNLNKQFLSQVLIAVNRLFPNLKQEQDFKRIQISNEEVINPYKIEDIHEARKDDFENQLKLKRSEFENSINLQKPKELDFTEKIDDGKIKEMDALIAETIARRNFDIEQINKVTNLNLEDPENWLNPQKITKNTNMNEKKQEFKEFKEYKDQNSDLNFYSKLKLKQIEPKSNTKKNVTWDDEKLVNEKLVNEKLVNETQLNNNMSLIIEEMIPINQLLNTNTDTDTDTDINTNKMDILITKVDTLIDLITILTKQLNSK
jgi:hypothetical protein